MAIKTPEGMYDLLPDEALFWDRFKSDAESIFKTYGYVPIYTPIVEQTELFVRGIGEATDVVSKEMFSAISGGNLEKLMHGETLKSKSRLSLRPEGTAGVVRSVLEHNLVEEGSAPVKLIYAGQMFRAERPQDGRQRQFNQIGVECLGAEDATIDAEAIIMLMRFFERIGIERDSVRLLINSMGCSSCRPAYRDLVYGYLCEHKDELCSTCKTRMEMNPLRAFDCKEPRCAALMEGAPKITDHLCDECKEHYARVLALLRSVGIEYAEDASLVRGLDYYTRTVFEVQTLSEKSQNALGGGGRYDRLAEEIGGRPIPGFGFALGYERCRNVLLKLGMEYPKAKRCDVFVACATNDVRESAFNMVELIRDTGFICDMDHQMRSLKSQFKLANKLDALLVVVVGPDELAQECVRVRNMNTHEEELVQLDVLEAYIGQAL